MASLGITKIRKPGCQSKEKNNNWKGGWRNSGSQAWANKLLNGNRFNAKQHGYLGPVGTWEEVVELWDACEGRCSICGVPELECRKKLCLDHDHASGQLRGFLCEVCNKGLGCFKDSPTILWEASKYLQKGVQ